MVSIWQSWAGQPRVSTLRVGTGSSLAMARSWRKGLSSQTEAPLLLKFWKPRSRLALSSATGRSATNCTCSSLWDPFAPAGCGGLRSAVRRVGVKPGERRGGEKEKREKGREGNQTNEGEKKAGEKRGC